MGEPKNPTFYDFGISGRVPGSQNQLFLSLETPGYLNKIKKNPIRFLEILIYKSQSSDNSNFSIFERAPTNPDEPSNEILNILEMGPISIKMHEMEIGNMEPISVKNSEGFLKPWNFETKKPRNQGTSKPRNQEPPYPSTYRLPPLHPTTL